MKILAFVADGFPTYRPDVIALSGRYLPRFGIHTDLVTHATDPEVAAADAWPAGTLLLCRRTGSRTRDQVTAFLHDLAVLFRIKRDDYDALQVRDKVFAAVFVLWAAHRLGKLPVFYWMSFPMSESYIDIARQEGVSVGFCRWLFLALKGYLGQTLLYRYVLPRCTHIFVQSERMREDLSARGVPRDRMTPVPMGVDLERAMPQRSEAFEHERLRGKRAIAYLGTFDRTRRLEFLLEVMQQLADDVPDAMLLMIGDGSLPQERQRLERYAEKLNIQERIVWTGWVSSAEAWQWLARADVAVSLFPRGHLLDSASPTKVVEYMALGVPVVANDQPDQKAVLDQSAAGLCTPMEHGAFAAAIKRILSNPGLAASMRQAGPRYVAAERSYATIAASVAHAYQRFIPRSASRS